jgi:hypothetical protein
MISIATITRVKGGMSVTYKVFKKPRKSNRQLF